MIKVIKVLAVAVIIAIGLSSCYGVSRSGGFRLFPQRGTGAYCPPRR